MGSRMKYSTAMLTPGIGLKNNQTGATLKPMKSETASVAGMIRRRIGDDNRNRTKIARSEADIAISSPTQPRLNQPTTNAITEPATHHNQASKSYKGLFTKRRKY